MTADMLTLLTYEVREPSTHTSHAYGLGKDSKGKTCPHLVEGFLKPQEVSKGR